MIPLSQNYMTGISNMATGNSRFIILYITTAGRALAESVAGLYPEAEHIKYTKDSVPAIWPSARAIVFIMASGIAVRSIAPYLQDKTKEPAVVVMDDKGRNIISLLGGHEAGANLITAEIAAHLGSNPVITTATDGHDLLSIDMFAKDHDLLIENRDALAAISRRHIETGTLRVYCETPITLPNGYEAVSSPDNADVIISPRIFKSKALMVRPRTLVLGVGLNSGTSADEIERAVTTLLSRHGLSPSALRIIATHEKKTSEPGLIEFAGRRGLRVLGISTEELNALPNVTQSPAAKKALGVQAVSEPAAILAAFGGPLIVYKTKSGNLTLAVAQSKATILDIVGTGPGGLNQLTPAALRAIRDADVIVGYKPYIAHIETLLHGKEIIATAMTEEVKRARAAVDIAQSGRRVAVISGGDAGIYGMAGLIYEVIDAMGAAVEVNVIPGITALNACASVLGAPLMHDFAAISLSDRLTPWEKIEERLDAAGRADFVIALYNPKSKGRATQLGRAREIIMRHRSQNTPVGIVESAMRPDQKSFVTTLEHMPEFEVGMRSTVIIGNSMSFRLKGKIITPRGYGRKYDLA